MAIAARVCVSGCQLSIGLRCDRFDAVVFQADRQRDCRKIQWPVVSLGKNNEQSSIRCVPREGATRSSNSSFALCRMSMLITTGPRSDRQAKQTTGLKQPAKQASFGLFWSPTKIVSSSSSLDRATRVSRHELAGYDNTSSINIAS